jgi:hypothetical protein
MTTTMRFEAQTLSEILDYSFILTWMLPKKA